MRVQMTENHFDHHGNSHKITHGIHEQHGAHQHTGEIHSAASNSSAPEQIKNAATGDGFGFWRTVAGSVKNLWGYIWGSRTGGVNEERADNGEAVGAKQTMVQVGAADVAENHGPSIAAAANVVQTSMTRENPYFTPRPDKETNKDGFMQRVRIRFRELTNQLKKRFTGRFGGRMAGEYSGRGTLNSKQQRPKEDLRRHSRYREDGLEMDCVLTDDSYLMDSYDRKGGYSTLTTKK